METFTYSFESES